MFLACEVKFIIPAFFPDLNQRRCCQILRLFNYGACTNSDAISNSNVVKDCCTGINYSSYRHSDLFCSPKNVFLRALSS